MIFTDKQVESFITSISVCQLMRNAVEWIQENLDVGEVFEPKVIKDWVNGEHDPEDIFDEEALRLWAERNGYTLF